MIYNVLLRGFTAQRHQVGKKLQLHRVRKKGATLFFAITLPNSNRSSKFFYHHTQQ